MQVMKNHFIRAHDGVINVASIPEMIREFTGRIEYLFLSPWGLGIFRLQTACLSMGANVQGHQGVVLFSLLSAHVGFLGGFYPGM